MEMAANKSDNEHVEVYKDGPLVVNRLPDGKYQLRHKHHGSILLGGSEDEVRSTFGPANWVTLGALNALMADHQAEVKRKAKEAAEKKAREEALAKEKGAEREKRHAANEADAKKRAAAEPSDSAKSPKEANEKGVNRGMKEG